MSDVSAVLETFFKEVLGKLCSVQYFEGFMRKQFLLWPSLEKYVKECIEKHPSRTIEECVQDIVKEVGGASYLNPSDKEKRNQFEKTVFKLFIELNQ